MTIDINATCEVAKSFSVKREKRDDDTEAVIAHLKIAELLLDRDQVDEIVGLPIGWSSQSLFDEFGAPLVNMALVLGRKDLTLSGVIRGGKDDESGPRLTLRDAEVSGITLDLTKLGALLSCGLAWEAAGDEVDDIADMLGKLCAIEAQLSDGGQGDLLRSAAANLRSITSVEFQDGDGNTLAKIENPKRKSWERAPE